MKRICIDMCPMTRVTSFHPEIGKPSPVTVTNCLHADLGIVVTSMCSQNVIGQTLIAALVSMMIDHKSFRCLGESLSRCHPLEP
eukprot:2633556-Amphidinium_carterae.1